MASSQPAQDHSDQSGKQPRPKAICPRKRLDHENLYHPPNAISQGYSTPARSDDGIDSLIRKAQEHCRAMISSFSDLPDNYSEHYEIKEAFFCRQTPAGLDDLEQWLYRIAHNRMSLRAFPTCHY